MAGHVPYRTAVEPSRPAVASASESGANAYDGYLDPYGGVRLGHFPYEDGGYMYVTGGPVSDSVLGERKPKAEFFQRLASEVPPQHPLVYAAKRAEHVADRTEDYIDRGYNKDGRGHSPDVGKLPNHPTFSIESGHPMASIWGGKWSDDNRAFEMSDWQMQNPNNTVFGLYTQGDGDVVPTYQGARVLPEITV